jgi:hypothetical protein
VTVAQYASIITSTEPALARAAREIRGCGYSTVGFTCSIGRLTYTTASEIVRIDLVGANRQVSEDYIGPPPQALGPLVKRTVAAQLALQRAESVITRECTASTLESDACTSAVFNWVGDQQMFVAALGAWRPYI